METKKNVSLVSLDFWSTDRYQYTCSRRFVVLTEDYNIIVFVVDIFYHIQIAPSTTTNSTYNIIHEHIIGS